MNFQWILLAFFAVSLLSGIAKAITRPMLKNVLRLICVPVAFIITFIIQACGLFQYLATLAVEKLNVASMIPGFEGALDFLVALCSTLLSPMLFVSVFLILLFVLRVLHVNLVIKYLEKRKMKKQEKELALAVKEEKKIIKEAIREDEKAAHEALEEIKESGEYDPNAAVIEGYVNRTIDDYVNYEGKQDLDKDDIEELAEERVAREKKRKKKAGFYKEPAEKKAISLVAGAVGGFLVFGIMLMPLFYTMSLFTNITDSVDGLDVEDSIVYQVIEVADKHVISPYEESFVAQIYESLALVDLMNMTTRLGGKMVLDNGQVVYADDVLKSLAANGVAAGAQITSGHPDPDALGQNIKALTANPVLLDIISDAALVLLQDLEVPPVADESDLIGGLTANIMNHYKNADKALIQGDLNAVSDTLVALIKTGLLTDLLAGGEPNLEAIMANEEMFGELIASMAGLSVFDPVVGGAFQGGIGMLGTTLGIPADDAAAYEIYSEHMLAAVSGDTAVSFDMDAVENFVKNCFASGKKANTYGKTDAYGYAQFIAYVAHWSKVQSVFANASEDLSYGYFTINVEDVNYVYDASARKFADMSLAESIAKYDTKVSPLAHLIHYVAQNSSATVNTPAKVNSLLEGYLALGTAPANCTAVVESYLAPETFVSKGVTVAKMQASTDFEDWTLEEKQNDSEKCVKIIFTLMDLMGSLGTAPVAEGELAGVTAMLDQFVVIGEVMDLMMETSCLNELPPLMLEGLVKNEMLSQFITPALAHQINETVTGDPDICYADYMRSLASTLKTIVNLAQ